MTLLGGAVGAWPLRTRAQQAKFRTIGFLGAAEPAVASHWLAALQRLKELGWSEGRTSFLRSGGPRVAEIAAPRSRPNSIGAKVRCHDLGSKEATSQTPSLFALATDPIGVA